MKIAILSLLMTWCTDAYCVPYANTLASVVEEVEARQRLDAKLLVAIAWHESKFRPFARSKVAGGPFQLHMASLWGRRAFFECLRPEVTFRSCLWLQASESAYVVRSEAARCGSLRGALSAYNTGQCKSEQGARYARRVLRIYRRL